jgi:hypothetical protein
MNKIGKALMIVGNTALGVAFGGDVGVSIPPNMFGKYTPFVGVGGVVLSQVGALLHTTPRSLGGGQSAKQRSSTKGTK